MSETSDNNERAGKTAPTPEQVREMVLRNIREAKDPAEADRILKAYSKAQQLAGVKLTSDTVSHLLGNALSPALACADLLIAEHQLTDKSKQFAELIQGSTIQAAEILHQLGNICSLHIIEFGGRKMIDLERSAAPAEEIDQPAE